MSGGNGKQLCHCRCHWDLSWLKFGDTRIHVTDVDGLFAVERGLRFLFIETKGEEEKLGQGQQIMLENLSMRDGFMVLVVRGPKGYPATVQRVDKGTWMPARPTSREDFQERVNLWWLPANERALYLARQNGGR